MLRTFSPSEAAMSVFGLAKRQPQFVLRFCIIHAIITIITFALAGGLGVGKALQDYVALVAAGGQPEPEAIINIITPATGGITLLLIFGVISGGILSTMGLRKAVRDEDVGLFGLQFGGDEIRLIGGLLLIWAALIGVNLAISILGALVTFGNTAMMGLTVAASVLVMAYVGLRFSQFGVLTIADRTMGLTPSWQETKGQTTRFLGAYLLWTVVGTVITALFQGVGTLGAAAMGAKVGGGMPASLPEFMSVGWLFYTLIYGLAYGFTNLGSICIGAYAWHQMRGDLPIESPDLK